MIRIFLDGMTAIPKDNISIKLTAENPFFTKSASYTYEVELPLSIIDNRRIFGNINRMDVAKEGRTFEAILEVDNVTVLVGMAHITSVTDLSVKVQLLGEAAAYNYGNKMENTYIDELDLGDWYMETWPDGSYWSGGRGRNGAANAHWEYYPEGTSFKGTCDAVFQRANYTANDGYDHDGLTMLNNLFSGEYPWVAFPVVNSSADILCNAYAYRFTSVANNNVSFFLRGYDGEQSYGKRPSDSPPVSSYAVQPYVWKMAELIAKATGFDLPRQSNALYSDGFLKRIFIANANNFIECNKCLPHWSVNEWWTQIEQTFGLVMTLDYANRRISLCKRKDFYNNFSKLIVLHDVVDEFSTDIDDESNYDISSSNVGYADHDNGPEDILSDFILDSATFNDDFNSVADLLVWGKSQQSMSGYKNVIFRCVDGRHYIYSVIKSRFEEVNMLRPRIVKESDRDIVIDLKFVPARFVDYDCEVYPYIQRNGTGGNVITQDKPVGSFPVKVLSTPNVAEMDWYRSNYDDQIDIDAILNDDEDESSVSTSAEDTIYIAVADLSYRDIINTTVQLSGGGNYSGTFSYPRAKLRARTVAPISGEPYTEDPVYSLSLIPLEGQTSLANETLSDNVRTDVSVRHCIKFLYNGIPDTNSVFLIRNKRYLCEKIEANIMSEGLDRLLTGYFYEVEL